jgi:hypothetical protein
VNENKVEKEEHKQHHNPITDKPIRIDDAKAETAWPALQIDVEYFQGFLDDHEIDESQKAELINTLWSIMVTFVDLGYGIEPTQKAMSEKQLANTKELIANVKVPSHRQLTTRFNSEKERAREREGANA